MKKFLTFFTFISISSATHAHDISFEEAKEKLESWIADASSYKGASGDLKTTSHYGYLLRLSKNYYTEHSMGMDENSATLLASAMKRLQPTAANELLLGNIIELQDYNASPITFPELARLAQMKPTADQNSEIVLKVRDKALRALGTSYANHKNAEVTPILIEAMSLPSRPGEDYQVKHDVLEGLIGQGRFGDEKARDFLQLVRVYPRRFSVFNNEKILEAFGGTSPDLKYLSAVSERNLTALEGYAIVDTLNDSYAALREKNDLETMAKVLPVMKKLVTTKFPDNEMLWANISWDGDIDSLKFMAEHVIKGNRMAADRLSKAAALKYHDTLPQSVIDLLKSELDKPTYFDSTRTTTEVLSAERLHGLDDLTWKKKFAAKQTEDKRSGVNQLMKSVEHLGNRDHVTGVSGSNTSVNSGKSGSSSEGNGVVACFLGEHC